METFIYGYFHTKLGHVMDNNAELSKIRDRILSLIKKGPGVVTTNEIASEFKLSWNTAEKYLTELFIENQVQRIKKAGVNLWMPKR